MRWPVILCVGLIGYGVVNHYQHKPIIHGAGEIASNEPIQTDTNAADIQLNGFTLSPLANYTIAARVLSRQDYSSGVEAELSPTDLAVGWGPMSDETVLNSIDISQGNRFFFFLFYTCPIPQHEIEIHAANMHIIPANDNVARQLSKVKLGQVVTIKGQLVEVKRADGWHWRSSLSREDTGNGACELIYALELNIS